MGRGIKNEPEKMAGTGMRDILTGKRFGEVDAKFSTAG